MSKEINELNQTFKKQSIVQAQSGDTVKVHQKIKEGNKERIQVFQGLVIKTTNPNNHLHRILVRRVSNGVGVEKSFLVHSPLVLKIEITKRSKVRRNYLSYMRNLTGKAARLNGIEFDRTKVNAVIEPEVVTETTETPTE
jgi:large subunit ribosomal protein L19